MVAVRKVGILRAEVTGDWKYGLWNIRVDVELLPSNIYLEAPVINRVRWITLWLEIDHKRIKKKKKCFC